MKSLAARAAQGMDRPLEANYECRLLLSGDFARRPRRTIRCLALRIKSALDVEKIMCSCLGALRSAGEICAQLHALGLGLC